MKQYSHVDYFGKHLGIQGFGFDKLDGNNLRFEYSKKRGFYKFGTKQMMIDENHEEYGKGVTLFLNKYSEGLNKIFRSKDYRDIQSFVCFAEFFGKKSKFGQHEQNDEFDIVLFDVDCYKKGFVKPKEFINDFGHLGIPKVVYQGNLNVQLQENVWRNNLPGYEGKLNEGIVFKGVINKGFIPLYYCKLKTEAWLTELKNKYGLKRYEEEFQ